MITRDDLGMRAYKQCTSHLLIDQLKRIRLQRSKNLLYSYNQQRFKYILFTNEKIFIVEEKYNKQNNKIYPRLSIEIKQNAPHVQRGHHSAQLWFGGVYYGTVLHRSISAKEKLKLELAFIRRVS